MAELATIARPYAEALFQASKADLTSTQTWLDELTTVASDAGMQQFAADPRASAAQVYDVIAGVVKATLNAQAQNFLRTVIDNGRLNALAEIATQFRALKNAQGGTSDAVVYSAFPIDGSALAEVKTTLEKRFARKLNVNVELAADLIGGIRVVVGDEVLDTSVKARLEQMKVALTA
jgi:F-type H+-transporting ATPase subunit delta